MITRQYNTECFFGVDCDATLEYKTNRVTVEVRNLIFNMKDCYDKISYLTAGALPYHKQI